MYKYLCNGDQRHKPGLRWPCEARHPQPPMSAVPTLPDPALISSVFSCSWYFKNYIRVCIYLLLFSKKDNTAFFLASILTSIAFQFLLWNSIHSYRWEFLALRSSALGRGRGIQKWVLGWIPLVSDTYEISIQLFMFRQWECQLHSSYKRLFGMPWLRDPER